MIFVYEFCTDTLFLVEYQLKPKVVLKSCKIEDIWNYTLYSQSILICFYLLKIVLQSNFFWINDSDLYQKCNKKNQFFLSFIAVCHSKSNNEDYKRHSMENLELDNCSNSRIFFLLLHNRGLDKLQLWQNKSVFWWTCHTRTTGSDSLYW